MAFKFVVFLAVVACAQAGLIGAPAAVSYSAAPAVSHVSYASPLVSYGGHQVPAITSQHQNILRSPGNLAQVSSYSKTIDTPFSSVSKHDVRVSNPGYATYAAPAYAAPIAHAAYAAPVAHAAYAAPALVTKTVAAPAYASYAAPVAHAAYAAPVAHAAYAAPALVAKTVATPAVAAHGLLGVAYSAAPAVSHMTYSNGYGITYGW